MQPNDWCQLGKEDNLHSLGFLGTHCDQIAIVQRVIFSWFKKKYVILWMILIE